MVFQKSDNKLINFTLGQYGNQIVIQSLLINIGDVRK